MPSLLLLAACIDNGLLGASGAEAFDPVSIDPFPLPDTAGDSDDSSDVFPSCAAAPSGAAAAPATCTSLPDVEWDMVIEADMLNLVDPANWAYIGAPVVAPIVAGTPPLILYQSWVLPAYGSVVAIDPVGQAVAWRLDNLGNDADHLAVARDAEAGSHGIGRIAVPTGSVLLQCADLAGGRTEFKGELASFPSTLDVTHDGVAEVVYDHVIFDATCVELFVAPGLEGTPARVVTPVAFDFDGSFDYGLAGSEGVTRLADGHTDRWDWAESFGLSFTFNPAVVSEAGELRVVLLNTDYLLVADVDAHVRWFHPIQPIPQGECSIPPAIGDVTGDGVPEILICEETWTSMFTLAGHRIWTHEFSEAWGPAGGMSMADLDADGRYEVIHWSENGLRILEGATGSVLAENVDVTTRALASEPVIADVDGDGSAEIVITGDWATESGERESMVNDHLFVFGAATGRWARTRPIWNQTPYDITTVRDDGSIVAFPQPNWQTYNSFRAQPAHDGDLPDLTLEVTETCADVCASGGIVKVAVQASNLGSREAGPGAEIRLFTWSEADGAVLVAQTTLTEAIPPVWSAEGVVFDVAWENWRERRFVEIEGVGDDECDLVNDRIDIFEDPCESETP